MDFPRKMNVLVTGTPACGKTSLCQMLQSELGLTHIDVGKLVKDERFYSEFDPAYDSYILEEDDEDRLLDYLEPAMVRGGVVLDWHSCEIFPRRWIGCAVVLRADTERVFDRLTARGYSEAKRQENLDAEIMGVCEDEARRSYHQSCIIVRQSNALTDMLAVVEDVRRMVAEWTPAKQEFIAFAEIEEPADDDDDDDGDDDGCGGDNADDDDDGGADRRRTKKDANNGGGDNGNDDGNAQQNFSSQQFQKGGGGGGVQ